MLKVTKDIIASNFKATLHQFHIVAKPKKLGTSVYFRDKIFRKTTPHVKLFLNLPLCCWCYIEHTCCTSPKKVSHLSTSQQRRVSADGYYEGVGSSGDPTGLVGSRDPRCWNCSQTGHVQRYCPYLVGAVDVNGETIRGNI